MNNDDFTAAAREEARLYWLETLQDETVGIGNLGQHMAEWARAHLAAQEPTDAERAVRELHAPRCHGMRDREGNPVDSCDHCYGPDGYNATYPCPTIQALDSARAARRDEEKR